MPGQVLLRQQRAGLAAAMQWLSSKARSATSHDLRPSCSLRRPAAAPGVHAVSLANPGSDGPGTFDTFDRAGTVRNLPRSPPMRYAFGLLMLLAAPPVWPLLARREPGLAPHRPPIPGVQFYHQPPPLPATAPMTEIPSVTFYRAEPLPPARIVLTLHPVGDLLSAPIPPVTGHPFRRHLLPAAAAASGVSQRRRRRRPSLSIGRE